MIFALELPLNPLEGLKPVCCCRLAALSRSFKKKTIHHAR